MTDAMILEAIEILIEGACELSAATGIAPSLKFETTPIPIYETMRKRAEAETTFAKCSCGDCGNIVAAFEFVSLTERDDDAADEDNISGAFISFVRQATDEETVAYLEEIVNG